MNKLSIVYCADENYIQHVAVSIRSLLKVSKDLSQYDIYLLSNNLSEHASSKLSKMLDENNLSFYIININSLGSILPKDIDLGKLGITTYLRLFLAEFLPTSIDKILYLDCDTVIMQDLSFLREYSMGDFSVCGVEDTMPSAIKKQTGMKEDDSYINAGVLLINLKKWRDTNITEHFLEFINNFNGKVPFLDQGVINGVLRDHGILPLAYNVHTPIYAIHKYSDLLRFFSLNSYYSQSEVKQAKKHPVILHFTALFVDRPWFKFCLHPQKKYYRTLLWDTPFAENGLQRNHYGWKRKIKMIVFNYFQPFYFALKCCKDRMMIKKDKTLS